MSRAPVPAVLAAAVALVVAPSLLTGCASSGGAANRQRQTLITREEITATSAVNAHELIQRLRPRWLQSRARISINTPSSIVVYQDDMNLGGIEALYRIPTEIVMAVRLLSAAEAGTLPGIGSQHVEHAIIVQTRREGRS